MGLGTRCPSSWVVHWPSLEGATDPQPPWEAGPVRGPRLNLGAKFFGLVGTLRGISTISAWLSADFGVVSNVVVVVFVPWVEVKSSKEFSSSPPGQYSSDVAKDSGEETPELSPVPDEDVNSWIPAVSEGPRGEDRSHGKGAISPRLTASL